MPEIAQVARLLGGVQFPELAPLMDELLYSCVRFVEPDVVQPDGKPFVRPLQDRGDVSDDIQDVGTRQYLRREVLALHTNFSLAAVLLNLLAAASELRNLSTLPTTRMSRRRSARSSAVTWPALHELSTVYGVEDLYDLLEVAIVDAHNRVLMMKRD